MTSHTLRHHLDARQALYQAIRQFFVDRQVREIETPLLAKTTALDSHLHSISADVCHHGVHYLQTSPEFAMKKALAAGSGPIFQICKAFRDGEVGSQHRFEFSMLEWYRPDFSLAQLIEETIALLTNFLAIPVKQQLSYKNLFQQHFQSNPHQLNDEALTQLMLQHVPIHDVDALYLEDKLDCLMDVAIKAYFANQPNLALLVLTDFPASQAAMSAVTTVAGDAICRRAEFYINGIEIANAYDELTDPVEQKRRFEADLAARKARGLATPPIDTALLDVMAQLPSPLAGIALGIDRLLMLQLGLTSLETVKC